MSRYIKPLIFCVELNKEQAVLAVCSVSGVYFDYVTGGNGWCVMPSGITAGRPKCFQTPKYGAGGSTGGDHEIIALPS
ncbi:MAG: hypothetical protein PHP69_06810 [Candidatus Omnitrophica bacterium]|jgi:hypothetical protein|nr:hypothetical protein [Candidatus Omnitrophota bacterium]MDD5081420.1 hypothetical protein [Candidatus Omnitrophota bacterium]MDD5441584.1 hypothetical protein [Candidatus Omnitrophota bacterium]